ncbi:MAG: hypothetical protein LBU84_10025 [Prevotella sp.]|jgi:hypothetical protein|nr:hypothetical protein [Prevotella sp.]
MDNKLLEALKTIYHYENGFYNEKAGRHEHKIPENISKDILNELERLGLFPNNFETITHDQVIARFMKIKNNKLLTEDFAKAMFYKGITGEYVRGRQTLTSYIFLKNLPEHKFTGKHNCDICSTDEIKTFDKTDDLFRFHFGATWNEVPLRYLLDLEEIINMEKPVVTETDKAFLDNLLNFISQAEKDETPGKLEKRLAKYKILPKTSKYSRYGILQTLAMCGILPNKLVIPDYDGFTNFRERCAMKTKGSPRSDIVLPLAGWRGEYGVDDKKYKEIFK